jgi:hypothetical protein
LTGVSLASNSAVLASAILELLKLWNYKSWSKNQPQWHYLAIGYHKNPLIGSRVDMGDTQRHIDRKMFS